MMVLRVLASLGLVAMCIQGPKSFCQKPDGSSETAAADLRQAKPAQPAENFFTRWQARATATQALQPKWIVPVSSPYPMLIQVFRADFTRQISPSGARTWNLGAGRGLNLIPFARTEVDVFVPPFFEHADATKDGFGDMAFSAKYRLLSGNESHGNYLLSGFLTASIPTGSYKNGSTDAVLSPSLSGGKGWGKVDVIANVGGTLPTGDTRTLGRTVTTSTVAQWHALRYVWPELNLTSTAWYGSARDGKVQTFLAPGLVLGRVPLPIDRPASRQGVIVAVGYQTAVTTYHAYNHGLIFSGRFTF